MRARAVSVRRARRTVRAPLAWIRRGSGVDRPTPIDCVTGSTTSIQLSFWIVTVRGARSIPERIGVRLGEQAATLPSRQAIALSFVSCIRTCGTLHTEARGTPRASQAVTPCDPPVGAASVERDAGSRVRSSLSTMTYWCSGYLTMHEKAGPGFSASATCSRGGAGRDFPRICLPRVPLRPNFCASRDLHARGHRHCVQCVRVRLQCCRAPRRRAMGRLTYPIHGHRPLPREG